MTREEHNAYQRAYYATHKEQIKAGRKRKLREWALPQLLAELAEKKAQEAPRLENNPT